MTTVVIGSGSALSAPEVAWSLLDAGYEVVAFDPHPERSPLRHEPRVRLVAIADPATDADLAATHIDALVSDCGAQAVMALDDASLWLVDRIENDITRIAPTGTALEIVLDKASQLEAATAVGLATPPTLVVPLGDDVPAQLPGDGPWVVKPSRAVVCIDGRLRKDDLHHCATRQDVVEAARSARSAVLVQSRLEGVGTGVFGLATDGGVLGWSGHERIRMMHPMGSGASAARSVFVPQERRDQVTAFLERIGWRGLFMVELLLRPDGSAVFMELNGRPWGSMALSRRQGLEYPSMAVRHALGGPVDLDAPPPDPRRRVRHAGRELVHLLHGLRGRPPGVTEGWPTRSEAARGVLSWSPGDRFYNQRSGRTRLWLHDTVDTVVAQVSRSRPRRIRAAVHVHSEWSYDATWSLHRLRETFERRRFDAVLVCEHDKGFDQSGFDRFRAACAEASSAKCVLVPGIEYSDPDNVVHVPVWGTTTFLGEGRPTAETLAGVVEHRAAAIMAHPGRRDAADRWDDSWATALSGIEVWNHKYDGMTPGRRAVALAEASGLPAVVSLDFHRRRQLGWHHTRIRTTGRTPDEIVAAIRTGAVEGAYGPIAVHRLTHGVGRVVLDLIESIRRPLAHSVRRLVARRRAGVRRRARVETTDGLDGR